MEEVMNVTEEAIENCVITEGLNPKTIVKASVAALCVGAAVTGFVMVRKYKGKIGELRDKRRIKALEKKGYTVVSNSLDDFNDENVEVNPEKE